YHLRVLGLALIDKQSNNNAREPSNLTDKELQERLENRSRIGFDEKDFIAHQKNLKEYREAKAERDAKNTISKIHYGQGRFLPQSDIRILENDKEYSEQQIRNKTDEISKKYYDQHQSPKNEFKDISAANTARIDFNKNKDKGQSRDR
ncbi:MAG: hypothetical protein AAFY41_05885, partial [Bacteroidota bacterium]